MLLLQWPLMQDNTPLHIHTHTRCATPRQHKAASRAHTTLAPQPRRCAHSRKHTHTRKGRRAAAAATHASHTRPLWRAGHATHTARYTHAHNTRHARRHYTRRRQPPLTRVVEGAGATAHNSARRTCATRQSGNVWHMLIIIWLRARRRPHATT